MQSLGDNDDVEPLVDTMLTMGNSTEGISPHNFMKYVI